MKYDPDKQYTWTNEATFELSGREFGLILNALRAILNTEQAAQILLAARANDAMEHIIAEYVEKDVIFEVKQEQNGNQEKLDKRGS